MPGRTIQNAIINENHKAELRRKARGSIFFRKYKMAEVIAKTLTTIIIILISFLLKK
jgi:hypothetical protein